MFFELVINFIEVKLLCLSNLQDHIQKMHNNLDRVSIEAVIFKLQQILKLFNSHVPIFFIVTFVDF